MKFTPTFSSVVEWTPGAFIFSLWSGWLAVNSLSLQLCRPNDQSPIWLKGVFMERSVTVVNPSAPFVGNVPLYKSFPDNSHVIAAGIILSFFCLALIIQVIFKTFTVNFNCPSLNGHQITSLGQRNNSKYDFKLKINPDFKWASSLCTNCNACLHLLFPQLWCFGS